MLETRGNLWDTPYRVDARIITTNGTIKKNGSAVMGRGCAREAKIMFPEIDITLGTYLQAEGNYPHVLGGDYRDAWLASFPVKHEWHQRADLNLIERSAFILVDITDQYSWDRVLLPRPGCGNGHLSWDHVRPILDSIFDDRFCVITF